MGAVTIDSIDNRIDTVTYQRIKGTTVTICTITMVNGFSVIGHSACVNEHEYDGEIGREIAYKNAFEQLWALEGYLACESRYREECAPCAAN